MKTFTVAFFGHRMISDFRELEEDLYDIINTLLSSHSYVEFLVGRNGDFDRIASSAIRRAQESLGTNNSAHILVLPYMTAEYRENEATFHAFYDEVEIYSAEKTHFKSAITKRNRHMAERADIVLCYVKEKEGGAADAVKYAYSIGKTVINFAEVAEKRNARDAALEKGIRILLEKGFTQKQVSKIFYEYLINLLCEDKTPDEILSDFVSLSLSSKI